MMRKIAEVLAKMAQAKCKKLQQRAYVVYEKHISYK